MTVLRSSEALELLAARLITIGAVGGLGTYFWRIQRRRRHEPRGASSTMPPPPTDA